MSEPRITLWRVIHNRDGLSHEIMAGDTIFAAWTVYKPHPLTVPMSPTMRKHKLRNLILSSDIPCRAQQPPSVFFIFRIRSSPQ